jgi:hypothetical protein
MDIVKIGIIGVYPDLLGGYDKTRLKEQHQNVYSRVLSLYNKRCIGITGMTIGSELDFAETCYTNNVPFEAIQIQTSPSHKWPADKDKYEFLWHRAAKQTILSEGVFSPLKIMRKWEYVIRESDALIYVLNAKYRHKDLINSLYNSGKKIFLCPT